SELGGIPQDQYAALSAELRGDALLKLGKSDEARSAYQQAMAKLDKDDAPARHVLQMKLDNLTQPAAAPTGAKAQ
ncbi:MAG: tetratricopeptide repeat protein, partial [Rhodanobacteraceae bacterium]